MKKNVKLSLLALIFLFFFSGSLLAEGTKTIFIENFKIHSPDKGDEFLAPGIASIIKTNISSIPGIKIVDSKDNAKYVISGNVMIIGEACISSASLMKNGYQLLILNKKGESKAKILDHVYDFAAKCKTKIQGSSTGFAGSSPVMENSGGMVPLQSQQFSPISAPNSTDKDIIFSTPAYSDYIKSLVVGDMNGNSKPEIAWITDKSLHIINIENGAQKLIAKKELDHTTMAVSVELADTSKGKDRLIILNAFNQLRNRFYAKAFELDKNGSLIEVKIPENYLYRTIYDGPDKKTILARKGGFRSTLFSGKIKRFDTKNGYKFKDFEFKKYFEFFPSFAKGNFTEKNQWVVLKNGNISVFNSDKQELWRSSEKYGGSSKYLDIQPKEKDEIKKRYFLPQRLISIGLEDGTSLIMTTKNNDVGKRLLQRMRLFKDGKVKGLGWNQISFDERFSTRNFQGWVSDFAIYDINNDGRLDLIVANPMKFGTLTQNTKSRVIVTKFQN